MSFRGPLSAGASGPFTRVATTRHKAGAYDAAPSAEVTQLIGIRFVAVLVLPTSVERPLAVCLICSARSPSFCHRPEPRTLLARGGGGAQLTTAQTEVLVLTIPGAAPEGTSEKRPYGREAPRDDSRVEFDDMPDRDIARIPHPVTIVFEIV